MPTTYTEAIKAFHPISTSDAEKHLALEELTIIYVGRESCPYCRKFAEKLSKLAPKINAPIYYIDSTAEPDIDAFREEYRIVTVPGFIVNKEGELAVRCDSSMPEEEILAMVQ